MLNLTVQIAVIESESADPHGVILEALVAWEEFYFRRGNAPYDGDKHLTVPSGRAHILWKSNG